MLNFALFFIILLLTLSFWYIRKSYSFWSSRGVSGPPPLPLLGNFLQRFRTPPDQLELAWARTYGKMYGMYNGLDPVLTITDHELIKQVLIKDFAVFANRRRTKVFHEVLSRHLFSMDVADGWKRVRTIVTPSFTTGKLRGMLSLMLQCIDKLDGYFEKLTSGSNNKATFDARPIFAGFTIDVIASTVFATETNANNDRSQENPFIMNGINLFKPSKVKILITSILPPMINRLLGLRTSLPVEPVNFYVDLCREIVKERRRTKGQRNDLIQMLMQSFVYDSELKGQDYEQLTATSGDNDDGAAKEKVNLPEMNKHTVGVKQMLTDEEIAAQCFIFFVAGFETTATTLSYAVYELAKNPDIQEKLYDEIQNKVDVSNKNNNRSTVDEYFDTVMHQMPLLDAVIRETLRKYPPVIRLQRRVGIDGYQLANVALCKNQMVEIPVLAVHYDPDYYPDPERFQPERWFSENKHQLVPYTFLPFGDGPRNCVGMRFAYQEIKLALAHLLVKYRFETNENTPDKFRFRAGGLLLLVKEIPITIVRRENQ